MFRRRKNRLVLCRAILLTLAIGLLGLCGGRFGFRTVNTQCPTAPIQQIAIMVKQADGSFLREVRAPRPGEKDFVVCHCQAKRSSALSGWFVPAIPAFMLPHPMTLRCEKLADFWAQPIYAFNATEWPVEVLIHPPMA